MAHGSIRTGSVKWLTWKALTHDHIDSSRHILGLNKGELRSSLSFKHHCKLLLLSGPTRNFILHSRQLEDQPGLASPEATCLSLLALAYWEWGRSRRDSNPRPPTWQAKVLIPFRQHLPFLSINCSDLLRHKAPRYDSIPQPLVAYQLAQCKCLPEGKLYSNWESECKIPQVTFK